FASGNNGNLIVESFGSAEISMRKTWKYVVLNILAFQRGNNPIHNAAIRTLRIAGSRYVVRDRTHESRDARFKLPACQRAARIETVCKFPVCGLRGRVPDV